ncbi:hypothetical protein RB195_021915 [Necator americanus]|uniref:Uncharacterized protein n=1 Tax=Necator americanus TaxID=51031 RepID=A0ABR1ED70_NECAM
MEIAQWRDSCGDRPHTHQPMDRWNHLPLRSLPSCIRIRHLKSAPPQIRVVMPLRGMPRLRDPAKYASKAKHIWVGHIMRRIDDRWAKRTLKWIPKDAKRPEGDRQRDGVTCSLHGWTG